MPGKKDPEYFPVNLNASGIGGFYGAGLNGPPHGKFEYDNSALNMSFNVSIPPVNSEEDETTDDESSSMTGSDIDVDMDTLVLSIREKLKMSPKFNTKPTNFWTESPPSSDNSHHSNNSVVVVNNNFDSGSSNNSNNNNSSTKRCRNHPYSQWRHSVHNNPTSHHHQHTNYHHRHIINGGIQKQHKSNCHHWWTSKSFNDISKAKKSSSDTTSTPHPYTLLQELIDSGSLIKEAVRRINLKQKRLTSINPNSNGSLSSLVI